MSNLTVSRVKNKRWNILKVTKIDENPESDWIAIMTFIFCQTKGCISTGSGARTISYEQVSPYRQHWTLK